MFGNIMNKKASLFIIISFLLILKSSSTESNNNDTSIEKSIKEKKATDVMQSTVCKKCVCDIENKLLDCSQKLNNTQWFSKEEWKILQDDKIIFETIKIDHNNLTEITAIPSYGVKNLYLSNNQITSIALGAFQNLTELAKLDLSNNKLSANDLKPDVFKGKYSEHDFLPMKNLKFLNLGCNLLHTLNADLFEHVPNLEELVLCSNTFTAIDRSTEAAVSGLLELKVLDISYMKVMTLPETIFHGPQKLEDLIASGNLFIELPKALSFAVNLKRLVLDENPIQNLEAKNVFPTLRKLQYLSIAYMPDIYKIGPGAFKELQNLKELILSDNQMLSEIDEQAFCKNVTGGEYLDYPPLEKLYLRNCKLTKLPQKLIRRWDKLNVLDLRMNPWTCDSSNEYMINYLMKQVNKSTPKLAGNVKCEFPEKLKGLEALQLSNEKLIDSSASDGLIWISLMIFILLAIPIILAGIVLHKRGFFRWHKKNDVSNRALYSRASFNEDVHI